MDTTTHLRGEERPLGAAWSLAEVVELFRDAGPDTARGRPPIRWLGGGPDTWGDRP
ncbi:hypothetical protein ACFVX6_15945 [Streptomyces sp. NPDC058289]|uniref:hypothetical protein n=1 Tax=Streptomyces sp. NPDC058289 TaxID=3346425 RepID=UPI0036EBBD9F